VLWLTDHPWLLSIVVLALLVACVSAGYRFRRDAEKPHSQLESARNGLNILLSLLLGFTLPMAQPHYDHRKELIVEEANAIGTFQLRAQLLPDPYRAKILEKLRDYLNSRVEFGKDDRNEVDVRDSLTRSKHFLGEMNAQAVDLVAHQAPNTLTPLFVQSLNELSDVTEKRLAAEENRIPTAMWLMLLLISMLTCLVTGYAMRARVLLEMLVLPLTVAIVLGLVAELDSPRTGSIRVGQRSMERLQLELNSRTGK
jgi:hypothetical protein